MLHEFFDAESGRFRTLHNILDRCGDVCLAMEKIVPSDKLAWISEGLFPSGPPPGVTATVDLSGLFEVKP